MVTLIGWTGTVVYLATHFYLALTHDPRLRTYYVANLTAAVMLVFSSAVIESWQAVATNVFWALISLAIVLRYAPRVSFPLSERWLMAPCLALGAYGVGMAAFDLHGGMGLLGWAGTATFALSYLLFASSVIQRTRFLWYNMTAAYSLVPVLFLDGNWPVFALEVAWGTISAVGLLRRGRSPAVPVP